MASDRAQRILRTLTAYYTEHCPDRLDGVQAMVERVVGGPPSDIGGMVVGGVLWTEEELYAKIQAKYGKPVNIKTLESTAPLDKAASAIVGDAPGAGTAALDDGALLTDTDDASVPLNDGSRMPNIGFGVYEIVPGDDTYRAVLSALQTGYRYIDTAQAYGNEEDVGKAIQASGIPRKDIFLVSKLWTRTEKFHEVEAFEFAVSKTRESLAKLDTYIDLYLLHSPHHPDQRMHFWRALEHLQEQGELRSIGVSNFGERHLKEILHQGRVVPAVNQLEVHPWLQRTDLVGFCRANGIMVLAYSPLAKAQRFGGKGALKQIAEKCQRSEAQVLLRWSLQKGLVPLPKTTKPDRMTENKAVFDFVLSDADMTSLDALEEHLVTGWDPTVMS